MELADPQRSYAVLIGTSAYEAEGLEDLPAVANNLVRLGELLRDPAVWGLPEERCLRVAEPRGALEVLDAIRSAARRAEDTLLVYYAGHGLAHPDVDGLLLTLAGTDPERLYTAVEFGAVRREVLGTGRNVNRVVILDCCYGGRAFEGGMSGAQQAVEMAEQTRIAGSYLLTASAATRQAQAPTGEPYTAFTGELIRLLEQGLPGGDAVIEAGRIYEHLYAELKSKGRPLPQQRLSNTGRTLAFARNRYVQATTEEATRPAPAAQQSPVPAAAAAAAPGAGPSAGGVPETSTTAVGAPAVLAPEAAVLEAAGSEVQAATSAVPAPEATPLASLRMRPGEMVEETRRLRRVDDRPQADALLGAAGAAWHPQEVASLTMLLARARRPGDVDFVRERLIARGPDVIAEYVDALSTLDHGSAEIEATVTAVAVRPLDAVAGTLRALRESGSEREAGRLLLAVIELRRNTEEILDFAGALWSAELDAEADRALAMATTENQGEGALLADALLAIGRREKAFELYVQAADAVVRRPVTEFVRVLRTMEEEGASAQARDLLVRWSQVILESPAGGPRATPPSMTAELCGAMWSAGLDGHALEVLRVAAETLSAENVIRLGEKLRHQGRDRAMTRLFRWAARASDVETLLRFADTLREMGRPVDARTLLTDAAHRPGADIAELLRTLSSRSRLRDRSQLLSALAERPTREKAELLRTPALAEGPIHEAFGALASLADEEFAGLLRELREDRDHEGLLALFSYVGHVSITRTRERLPFLKREFPYEETVLRFSAIILDPERVGRPRARRRTLTELLAEHHPSPDLLAYAMAALCADGWEADVKVALRSLLRTDRIAGQAPEFVRALRAASLDECATAVLQPVFPDGAATPQALRGYVTALIDALQGARLHDDAGRVLNYFAARLGFGGSRDVARRANLTPPPLMAYVLPPR